MSTHFPTKFSSPSDSPGFLLHPEDSRAKCVSATAEGVEVVNVAVQLVEQEDDAFFATLEGDLAGFVACLRTLVASDQKIKR